MNFVLRIRGRVSVEVATREAVQEKRPFTWVAGIPRVWGAPVWVRVQRRLWEV